MGNQTLKILIINHLPPRRPNLKLNFRFGQWRYKYMCNRELES